MCTTTMYVIIGHTTVQQHSYTVSYFKELSNVWILSRFARARTESFACVYTDANRFFEQSFVLKALTKRWTVKTIHFHIYRVVISYSLSRLIHIRQSIIMTTNRYIDRYTTYMYIFPSTVVAKFCVFCFVFGKCI